MDNASMEIRNQTPIVTLQLHLFKIHMNTEEVFQFWMAEHSCTSIFTNRENIQQALFLSSTHLNRQHSLQWLAQQMHANNPQFSKETMQAFPQNSQKIGQWGRQRVNRGASKFW